MPKGTIRKLSVVGLATFCLVGCGLLLSGAPALGAEAIVFQKAFGSAGAGNGQFSQPTGVAVNNSTGEVYVVDGSHDRVERFGASGEYLGQFDGETSPTGKFASPNAVAVDSDASSPSFGDVYVSDPGHDVVDKFTATGAYINQLTGGEGRFEEAPVGVAVDPSGNLWVYESESGLDEFDDAVSNGFVTRGVTSIEAIPGMAVDSRDGVYVVPINTHGALRFVLSGYQYGFFPGLEGCGCVTGIGVDPASNDVYVDQGTSVVEYGPFGEPNESPIAQFGSGRLSGGSGVAVAAIGQTHAIYVVDSTANEVDIFFRYVGVPNASTGAVSNSRAVSATVGGVTNPEGVAVSGCKFEYGTSEAYGSSAGCSSLPGAGTESVPVSAELTGLLPGTLYHYRLAVGNANGPDYGADEVFRTPAKVGSLPTSNMSALGATLNATIEPGSVPTSYHFEYGTSTAYGQVVPVPDLYAPEGYAEDEVSQAITGLQPDTTYHYAVVANSPGGTVTGPDEQFTTPPVPLPGVETGGASEVTTGSAALAGAVDPMGWDTSYQFQYGTSTGYGQSWPSVAVELGAFEGGQGVVATVEGLQPGTLYHYRVVASNPGGTSYGPDQTFTTASYPSSVMQVAPVGAPIGVAPPSKTSAAKPKAKQKPKSKRKRGSSKGKGRGKRKKG